MKANRFALKQDEEAVSPVIAVILMVAITVVLAATIYVWVSGFGTSGSIKKFPQVTLKDGPDTLTGASGESIATLEHRGGDAVNWADYTVNVFEGTASSETAVDFDDATDCSSPQSNAYGTVPTGTFAVGNKLYVCSAGATWASGDVVKVQIVDNNQNSIVYENTVVST